MLSSTQTNLLIILLISPLRYLDYKSFSDTSTENKPPTAFNYLKYKVLSVICAGVLAHFMKGNIINLSIITAFCVLINIIIDMASVLFLPMVPILSVIIQVFLQIILLFLVNFKSIQILLGILVTIGIALIVGTLMYSKYIQSLPKETSGKYAYYQNVATW